MAPTCRPIWATSSVWVSLVRAKSSVPATRICVFAPSLRSADECTTRARSRSKAVRDFDFGGSPPSAARRMRCTPPLLVCVRRCPRISWDLPCRRHVPVSSLAKGSLDGAGHAVLAMRAMCATRGESTAGSPDRAWRGPRRAARRRHAGRASGCDCADR